MSWLVPEVRVGDEDDCRVEDNQFCRWTVQQPDDDENGQLGDDGGGLTMLGSPERGNLPREGALLLPIPYHVPRRRHSWICR